MMPMELYYLHPKRWNQRKVTFCGNGSGNGFD
jgi:hypothetical protein